MVVGFAIGLLLPAGFVFALWPGKLDDFAQELIERAARAGAYAWKQGRDHASIMTAVIDSVLENNEGRLVIRSISVVPVEKAWPAFDEENALEIIFEYRSRYPGFTIHRHMPPG